MNLEDETLEAFLRRFQPRQPTPLPPAPRSSHWPLWIAAGLAAIAIGSAAFVWRTGASRSTPDVAQDTPGVATLTAGRVSRITNWDPDALDRMLSAVSARVLPEVESPEGALRVLAQYGDKGVDR